MVDGNNSGGDDDNGAGRQRCALLGIDVFDALRGAINNTELDTEQAERAPIKKMTFPDRQVIQALTEAVRNNTAKAITDCGVNLEPKIVRWNDEAGQAIFRCDADDCIAVYESALGKLKRAKRDLIKTSMRCQV